MYSGFRPRWVPAGGKLFLLIPSHSERFIGLKIPRGQPRAGSSPATSIRKGSKPNMYGFEPFLISVIIHDMPFLNLLVSAYLAVPP